MPIFFSWVDLQLGAWKIDKYNAVNVLLSLLGCIVFMISFFFVADLSKELDQLKAKYSNTNHTKARKLKAKYNNTKARQTSKIQTKKPQQSNKDSPMSNNIDDDEQHQVLMKFKDLIQINILVLIISYGIIRYATIILVSMISMYAMSMFHWLIYFLSWIHLGSGTSAYAIITILIKLKIFKGTRKRMYFFYITASIFTLLALVSLLLPRIINISSFPEQVIYLVLSMLIKCWIYFHAQSSGKVLLFSNVSSKNSCTVDSVRSSFGAIMKLFALATSFLFFYHPEYFVLPIGIIQFFCIGIILFRHGVYI